MKKERLNAMNLSDSELIIMLNDIYDYKNGNGDVDKSTILYSHFKGREDSYYLGFGDYVDDILFEGSIRFDKATKVLMVRYPYFYIR